MENKTEQFLMARMDQLIQQVFLTSLMVEFLIDNLVSAKDSAGEPLIKINLDEFNGFATRRAEEIEAEAKRAEVEAREAQEKQIKKYTSVKLDE